MPTRIAIVPVLDPTKEFVPVVRGLRALGFEIVVVDDGSVAPPSGYEPGTAVAGPWAQVTPIATVLHHGVNRGKGHALRTGLDYVARTFVGPYTVVTVDADGQHRPRDADRLCDVAESHPGALVLGSRELAAHAPLRSRLGNATARALFRLATHQRLRDTQTGLRACTDDLVPALLQVTGERYEYEMNVLLNFAARGVPLIEIPVAALYLGNNESSHYSPLRDSWRIARELARFAGSSFLGFLVDYAVFSAVVAASSGGAIVVANVLARVISGSVNFTVNHRLVFHSERVWWRAALRYAALSAGILAANTVVLSLLVHHAGWSPYVAKIATELAFFFVAWGVQRTVVFQVPRPRLPEAAR